MFVLSIREADEFNRVRQKLITFLQTHESLSLFQVRNSKYLDQRVSSLRVHRQSRIRGLGPRIFTFYRDTFQLKFVNGIQISETKDRIAYRMTK